MQNQELHIARLKTHHKKFIKYLDTLGYDKSTKYIYNRYVKEFLCWMQANGIHEVKNLTQQHFRDHLTYLIERPNDNEQGALSGKTIGVHFSALKAFVQFLINSNHLKFNVMGDIALPSARPISYNILTVDEIHRLYSVCTSQKERAILSLFYGCGLRRTEAELLNINDINFREQLLYVRVGKGKKRRVVPMSNQVTQDLKGYFQHERKYQVKTNDLDSQKAYMLNNRGSRISGKSFLESLKQIIHRTGDQDLMNRGIVLHSLRHSIATHLLQRGVDIEYIRDFLGHDQLDTTMLYTRITQSNIQ
ncbi:tyrosine-type recombinase/integrase [Fulvivirga sp.]|uniref:tyrosine-type recombinase/integrase n=1 Tax=Fulvivirga sp. TaxID=1931237 RepID=UPI0032EC5261